ncbi:hypothetical protein CIPAW_16G029600 [Carya illinoinensis]|uniref:Uncharacterized protein n=1 Tax=Carya illinoinensis TaxID=32201 RepID=A0A8T1N5D8_CARIL|nr:hypothetical protein CIPAW_16G029600 [Carya illinoinensis]
MAVKETLRSTPWHFFRYITLGEWDLLVLRVIIEGFG